MNLHKKGGIDEGFVLIALVYILWAVVKQDLCPYRDKLRGIRVNLELTEVFNSPTMIIQIQNLNAWFWSKMIFHINVFNLLIAYACEGMNDDIIGAGSKGQISIQ